MSFESKPEDRSCWQRSSKAGVGSLFKKYGTVLLMKVGTTVCADVRVQVRERAKALRHLNQPVTGGTIDPL